MHRPTIDFDGGRAAHDRNAGKNIHAHIGRQVIDDVPYALGLPRPRVRADARPELRVDPEPHPAYRDLRLTK